MAPTDNTPNIKTTSFSLIHSSTAFNKIPVYEYKSNKTGLTVAIAEIDGPVVNGYFCVVTETFDDDGLPHTLEHLIFLGSEDYPYKGVLDLLANRCLASGTNGWTDIDHTCYTIETAGSDGFLSLLPIYLDHILYPVLTDEGYITEVHHITGEGEDAGVVYCEMQGRENSAESRLYLNVAREMYPGKCGYNAETGGLMKNLRESTNNVKVRNFHKEFYRPENLKLIITGKVCHDDVFKALERVENKILSKGALGEFTRPWQGEVKPLEKSKDLEIKYPSDDETNGLFNIAWRGPSSVNELYLLSASVVLMKYLTKFSVSPLQKEFVEIPDPFANKVTYNQFENSVSCLCLLFQNVPVAKLPLIKDKLYEILRRISSNNDIDMERMKNIIIRHKLETLSNLENTPHHCIAFSIIGHMLYGHNKNDLETRINPLTDLDKMLEEPKEFWLDILRKYFIDNHAITIQAYPSTEEQQHMALDEKGRIDEQIRQLGETGLKYKGDLLNAALKANEIKPPNEMLTVVPIPSIDSISFHSIQQFKTDNHDKEVIDLENTPLYTFFDHVNTNFVYMFTLMDTSKLAAELRPYLPLFLEYILEAPIKRNGQILSYEDVVTQLNNDTVETCGSLGLGGGSAGNFKCGKFSQTAVVMLQVETSKYAKGVSWMRELLYQVVFDVERLKIVATKIVNNVTKAKRNGRNIASYLMKEMCYIEDCNNRANGILKQQAFLTKVLETLNSDKANDVIKALKNLRTVITDPVNMNLYCAANLDNLPNAVSDLADLLPSNLKNEKPKERLNYIPNYSLLAPTVEGSNQNCIVGMGCLESTFFYQCVPCINSYTDPDLPALLLYLQYLTQCEGPLWKQVRGKGYSYGYTIQHSLYEGILYLAFAKASNIVGAYKESYNIVMKQIKEKDWDKNLLDSARSSLIFEIIEQEKTIVNAIYLSLASYLHDIDYKLNRTRLRLIENVTIDDLNKIGEKYIEPLFDPTKVKTAIVCDPSKAPEYKTAFEQFNLHLNYYPSLEESFVKV